MQGPEIPGVADEELRAQRVERQRARELRIHERLHEISSRRIPADAMHSLYGELIDVAIDIAEADRGTMQSLDCESGELRLLEARDMPRAVWDRYGCVPRAADTSCSLALREGERAVVDYHSDERVADTEDARAHLEEGIRAAQSTPLVARSGRTVGMLSTHWERPYRLSERQADLLDILARQAADLIERTHAEEALRESERRERLRREQFETLLDQAPLGIYFIDADFRIREVNPAAEPVFPGLREGVIGRDFREVLRAMWTPDRAEQIVEIFRHTLETGEPYHVPEFAERRADLEATEYYDWRTERIPLPDGRYGVVCYFRDISDQVNARLEIARSEERYRTLFDSMDEGFFVAEVLFGADGEAVDYRFIETNPAFERHTGLVDVMGKTALEVVPGLERRWIEVYGRVAMTGGQERFVLNSKAMGRWFEVDAFRIGEEESRRIAALFTDVTERKNAETALRESEERLRLAKAAADIGIHDYNVVTGEIGWDERTREIWGVGAAEPITYDLWLSGLHPDDRDRAEGAVRRALDPDDERRYFVEHRVVNRRDGITRWVQVTGQPTFCGREPVRLVGTVRDITEQKRAEEALKEADRRKDEFLATLAHELRSPLAAITAATSALGTANDEPSHVRRMTTVIERQSAQLVRLIDDLMDVSRISHGKLRLERERIDAAEIVRQVVADTLADVHDKGLERSVVVPEQPIMVVADPVRFAQVVTNLVHNASRFTPAGGEIRVAVEREGEEVVVRVADSGIGMSPEELSRIFELFTQGDGSLIDRSDGLGIGLSLARSIVELHGGTIEARSEGPGKGSEFVVRFPASLGGHHDPDGVDKGVAPAEPGESKAGRRIVAAEDNRDALDVMAVALRIKGHEVETAADGTEALEKIREHRPDVALLDIGMPGLDGYEVARSIRREPWGQGMLLVAMTGWGRQEDRKLAFEAGFDRHLTKPVDLAALDEVLRSKDG